MRRQGLRAALVLFPVAAVLASLFIGRYPVGFREVAGAFLGADVPPTARVLILDVRLPRALGAAAVGASLALAGAAFQGLFRNPLVDSRILGVSAGAAFGAALALLLGVPWYLVDGFAFAFGLLAVFLVVLIARRFGGSVLVLVISGILVGSLFSAFLGVIKYIADPLDVLPAITYWLLGSLAGTRWDAVGKLIPACLLGAGALLLLRWRLNVLSLEEREAAALGVDVGRLRTGVVLAGTLLVAAAVSQAGMIGWIGLITPHAARALVGPDHMRVLPASMALGAGFLVALDLLSRSLLASEVPLGVLTGIVGVPAFLFLFMRHLARGGGWR
ncbi:FecCD family ABC transporter permease [Candidatus Bipolaricaulota sp. J31]